MDIRALYEKRFLAGERVRKEKLWQILCCDFLQQFIKDDDIVLDVGSGLGEFINNIRCGKKIALDVNSRLRQSVSQDVKVIIASVKHLNHHFAASSIDVIFMSNLLEHLDSKEEVFRLLKEAYGILKAEGRLLIMQPDIKLVGHAYWDFFDHKVPITLDSLVEVLKADGFYIKYIRYPFLPYSTKVRFLPLWPLFLKLYLRLRPFHYIFGKQFFICAKK